MRPEELLSAIGQLDDEMIANTEKRAGSKRPPIQYFIAVAAAIVILTAVALVAGLNVSRPEDPSPVRTEDPLISTDDDAAADHSENTEKETETDRSSDKATDPDDSADGPDHEKTSVDRDSEPDPPEALSERAEDPVPAEPSVTGPAPSAEPEETVKPWRPTETESDKPVESVTETTLPDTDPEESSGQGGQTEPYVAVSKDDAIDLLYRLAGSPVYYESYGSGYGGMGTLSGTDSENAFPYWLSRAYWWRDFIDSVRSLFSYDRQNGSETVTRGDAAIYLYGFANKLNVTLPVIREFTGFTDCSPGYYKAPAVNFVYVTGLMEPIGEDRFGMNEPVSREEFENAARTIASYKG